MAESTKRTLSQPAGPEEVDRHEILVIDGDSAVRKLLRRLLDREGYQVREAPDIHQAIAELHKNRIDLAVINFGLDEQGQEAIRTFQYLCPSVQVLVLSGADSGLGRPGTILERIKKALTEGTRFSEVN